MNSIFKGVILAIIPMLCFTLVYIFIFPIMDKNKSYVPIGILGSAILITIILYVTTCILGVNW